MPRKSNQPKAPNSTPVRGASVTPPKRGESKTRSNKAEHPGQPADTSGIDYDKLAEAILRKQNEQDSPAPSRRTSAAKPKAGTKKSAEKWTVGSEFNYFSKRSGNWSRIKIVTRKGKRVGTENVETGFTSHFKLETLDSLLRSGIVELGDPKDAS